MLQEDYNKNDSHVSLKLTKIQWRKNCDLYEFLVPFELLLIKIGAIYKFIRIFIDQKYANKCVCGGGGDASQTYLNKK